MNKQELQDRAWNSIPSQMRDEIMNLYREHWTTFNTRLRMEQIFGEHNLTQPEEPSEARFSIPGAFIDAEGVHIDIKPKLNLIVEGWIVRGQNGELLFNYSRPYKENGMWLASIPHCFYELPSKSFFALAFDDSPQKARITITPVEG